MLTVSSYEGAFPQVHIDADRTGMRELAQAVVVRRSVDCVLAEDHPDLRSIVRILVILHDKGRLHAKVDRENRQLLILGNEECLSVLASNILQLSDCAAGDHEHVEWFDGNQYVEEGSVPMILSLVSPA